MHLRVLQQGQHALLRQLGHVRDNGLRALSTRLAIDTDSEPGTVACVHGTTRTPKSLPNQLRTDCYLSTYAGGSCNGPCPSSLYQAPAWAHRTHGVLGKRRIPTGWRVNGAYIDSGNSTGVNNVRSSLYLTLSVRVLACCILLHAHTFTHTKPDS